MAGQVVIRPMMYVALSYDHRLVDGRQAVSIPQTDQRIHRKPGTNHAGGVRWAKLKHYDLIVIGAGPGGYVAAVAPPNWA